MDITHNATHQLPVQFYTCSLFKPFEIKSAASLRRHPHRDILVRSNLSLTFGILIIISYDNTDQLIWEHGDISKMRSDIIKLFLITVTELILLMMREESEGRGQSTVMQVDNLPNKNFPCSNEHVVQYSVCLAMQVLQSCWWSRRVCKIDLHFSYQIKHNYFSVLVPSTVNVEKQNKTQPSMRAWY